MKSTIATRRDFLAGAAVSSAAAGLAGLMGTATEALADEKAPSGAVPAWLGEEPQIDESQIASREQFDLVVCGAGPAGLLTAALAAEQGLSAVIIESYETSSTFRNDVSAIDSSLQAEFGVKVDKAAAIHDIMRYTTGAPDLRLWKI